MNINIKAIVMVPKVVFERAKKLKEEEKYEEALSLLERNKVEAEVYNDHVEMKISKEPTKIRRNRGFRKTPYIRKKLDNANL